MSLSIVQSPNYFCLYISSLCSVLVNKQIFIFGRRTCRVCDLVAKEDKKHFLLDCDLYNDIRTNVFGDILRQNELILLNTELKIKCVVY